MHLHMVPEVRLGGEALVTVLAGEGFLLGVDTTVADELRGHTEGLATVWTLVTFGLGVDPPMVLQRHQVGELFLAGVAEVGPSLVAVLVVEEGASVAVRAPTLVTDVSLHNLSIPPTTSGFGDTACVESLLLHQGEIQA